VVIFSICGLHFVSALVLAQHVPASALIGRHSRGSCKHSDWLTFAGVPASALIGRHSRGSC